MRSGILENPVALFIVIPFAALLFPHVFLLTGGYYLWIMPTPREIGYVENATALFFLFGGLYAFSLVKMESAKIVKWFRPAIIFYGLVAIWVALEEVSYGQQFLHFTSPEWFLEHNFNKEVNIHNLAGDAISHSMKTAGYIVVSLIGIIAPLAVRFGNIRLSRENLFYYFIPGAWLIFPSLLSLFANLPKTILKLMPDGAKLIESSKYFNESGEYEEYMLGVWIILYVAMVHRGLRGKRKALHRI